jgi:hypothetical protein
MLICFASGWRWAHAQAPLFDATKLREPTGLNAGWLIHGGDDPAFARPDCDDSGWTRYDANNDTLRSVFPQGRADIVWYRLHIRVAPDQIRLGLLEHGLGRAFEIYADGERIISVGQVDPLIRYVRGAWLVSRIPDREIPTGILVIAVRLRVEKPETKGFGNRQGLFPGQLILGQEKTLRREAWLAVIGSFGFRWLDGLLNLGMLVGAILLYTTQRDHREYLWLSIWAMIQVFLIMPAISYLPFGPFPISYLLVENILIGLLAPYTLAGMYCAFVEYKPGRTLKIFLILTGPVPSLPTLEVMYPS